MANDETPGAASEDKTVPMARFQEVHRQYAELRDALKPHGGLEGVTASLSELGTLRERVTALEPFEAQVGELRGRLEVQAMRHAGIDDDAGQAVARLLYSQAETEADIGDWLAGLEDVPRPLSPYLTKPAAPPAEQPSAEQPPETKPDPDAGFVPPASGTLTEEGLANAMARGDFAAVRGHFDAARRMGV